MKKGIVISLLSLLAVCFTACTKSVPGCTCDHSSEPECKYHTQTLNLRVMQPDWQFDNNALQYYYHFDVPEITAKIYDLGNWTICREFYAETEDAYQVALPMSTFMTDTLQDGSVAYYTRHIDYRLGVGYVEIQLTNSDYYYPAENPEDMLFRLQLIY